MSIHLNCALTVGLSLTSGCTQGDACKRRHPLRDGTSSCTLRLIYNLFEDTGHANCSFRSLRLSASSCRHGQSCAGRGSEHCARSRCPNSSHAPWCICYSTTLPTNSCFACLFIIGARFDRGRHCQGCGNCPGINGFWLSSSCVFYWYPRL